MPADFTDGLTLRYRGSFLLLMLLAGLVLGTGGLVILIASVVLFRPQGLFAGGLLGVSGMRLLRRYGRVVLRRQAAFQFDRQGLRYVAPDGYFIPWAHVLGLHAVRRGARLSDLYFYLSENPDHPIFMGETDPRAAMFANHRPESPNQVHLRMSHFDTGALGDVEAAFRALLPREGAFPARAKILFGHLAPLNRMLLIMFMTVVFGGLAGGIMASVADWSTGFLVFGLFQVPAVLAFAAGRLRRWLPGWATPRIIACEGMVYLPGTVLGRVRLDEILNVRYRLGTLVLLFTTSQESVRNFQYNPFGVAARAAIFTRGNTRRAMAEYFSLWHLWENGKTPDVNALRAKRKADDAELKRITAKYRAKPKRGVHT